MRNPLTDATVGRRHILLFECSGPGTARPLHSIRATHSQMRPAGGATPCFETTNAWFFQKRTWRFQNNGFVFSNCSMDPDLAQPGEAQLGLFTLLEPLDLVLLGEVPLHNIRAAHSLMRPSGGVTRCFDTTNAFCFEKRTWRFPKIA